MRKQAFVVRYEGGDAKQHVLDMRQLGESLIGIERLINTGLYVMEHGERPGHGRVLKSVVRVSTPRAGSLEFIPDLVAGVYPLLGESIVQRHIGAILRQLVKTPLLAMGGLEHQAQDRTVDLLEKVMAASDRAAERTERADERRHREQMKAYDLLAHQWAYDAARNAVSPVGNGCDCMQISDDETSDTVTPMMAKAIRTRGSMKIGEPRELFLLVDGFIHRTRQLRVVHPDLPDRLVTAYVRDPAFNVTPNIYTEAASSRKRLRVHARELRKGDRLVAVEIMKQVDG